MDTLPKLAEHLKQQRMDPACKVSAIGCATSDRDEWNQARENEAGVLNRFQSSCEGTAEIQAYEVPIPEGRPEGYFNDLMGFSAVDVFAELPWQRADADVIAAAAESDWLALKIRSHGIPSCTDLAELLWGCVSLEVPLKWSGGPVTAFETGRGPGIINLLTAAVLAYSQDLPATELAAVLGCSDPLQFSFSAEALAWNQYSAGLEDIEAARQILTRLDAESLSELSRGLAILDAS